MVPTTSLRLLLIFAALLFLMDKAAASALTKSRLACEAGVSKAREAGDSIKPGAQAPGSPRQKICLSP